LGSAAVNAMSSAMLPPGATGCGSRTRASVRSWRLPSSGASKVSDGSRSAPPAIRSVVTSIWPQPFSGIGTSRSWPRDSRKNVLSRSRNPFR
jgi:hypothetical protein